jgi:hypothetical protein
MLNCSVLLHFWSSKCDIKIWALCSYVVKNHRAKSSHSVFYSQMAQSQRDPGRTRVGVWSRSTRSLDSEEVAQTLSGRKNRPHWWSKAGKAGHTQTCKFVCLWRLFSVCLRSRSIRATVCYRPTHWMMFARNLIMGFYGDLQNGDLWEQVIVPSCSSFSWNDSTASKDVSDGRDRNGKLRQTLKTRRR